MEIQSDSLFHNNKCETSRTSSLRKHTIGTNSRHAFLSEMDKSGGFHLFQQNSGVDKSGGKYAENEISAENVRNRKYVRRYSTGRLIKREENCETKLNKKDGETICQQTTMEREEEQSWANKGASTLDDTITMVLIMNIIRRRTSQFLQGYSQISKSRKSRPNLPANSEILDYLTRNIGGLYPSSKQNSFRDSGKARALLDFGAPCVGAHFLFWKKPSKFAEYSRLTQKCVRINYGDYHEYQGIDMFFPNSGDGSSPRGLIFFVHGGAWGSGAPWMYRLIASPFLKKNLAVAIVGYRTYPDGDANAQIQDLESAADELARRYPALCRDKSEIGVCVMGHSSGAHISMLMIARHARQKIIQWKENNQKHGHECIVQSSIMMRIDSFIGLSGPYDIATHFDLEAARGLEELSPLKPANGHSREEFRKHSPALYLRDAMSERLECEAIAIDNFLPKIALIHGMKDNIVPYTATSDAARILRSCGFTKCDELYLTNTGHNDIVGQVMVGGKAQNAINGWLQLEGKTATKSTHGKYTARLIAHSKL